MISKKGEKWLSPWLIFIIAIIAGGLVIGVGVFINAEIDINDIESEILVTNIARCLLDNGYIDEDFLAGNFNLYSKCGLSENLDNSGKYYLKFEVYELKNCNSDIGKITCLNAIADSGVIGANSIKTLCYIKGSSQVKKGYPECSERYIYALNKKDEKLILHIYAGSSQSGTRESSLK